MANFSATLGRITRGIELYEPKNFGVPHYWGGLGGGVQSFDFSTAPSPLAVENFGSRVMGLVVLDEHYLSLERCSDSSRGLGVTGPPNFTPFSSSLQNSRVTENT